MQRVFAVVVSLVLAFGATTYAASFPAVVVDDRGQEITIDESPERIVAVSALYAQIVVDLGALDRLVAVGQSADNPAEVLALPTVGPSFAPSVETILGFSPDLVLGAGDYGGERPALESAGVTVLTTPWLTSIQTIFGAVRAVASATGMVEEGDRLIGRIATEIVETETLALGRDEVSAAFLYASSPDDPPYVAGSDAIEHELIARARGWNVFADVQWSPQVSFEEIIARNPDVIFVAPSQIENVRGNANLQSVAAVANGRVVGIRASAVASTRVAEALRAMVDALGEVE